MHLLVTVMCRHSKLLHSSGPPTLPQAWADVPEVTTPMLKFMAEFVLNKSTRLTFDASSPSGILLFR